MGGFCLDRDAPMNKVFVGVISCKMPQCLKYPALRFKVIFVSQAPHLTIILGKVHRFQMLFACLKHFWHGFQGLFARDPSFDHKRGN
jgi:hypothetical protein